MNHFPLGRSAAGTRAVNRAIGELRRGVAVVIIGTDGDRALALPAETAMTATLEEFLAEMAPGGNAALLVAPSRAVALAVGAPFSPTGSGNDGGEAGGDLATVAIDLRPDQLNAEHIRRLADPTSRLLDPEAITMARAGTTPVEPAVARAGLLLAKLARLLPAVLVAEAAGAGTHRSALLEVDAADILAYPADTSEGLVLAAEASVPLEQMEEARVVAFRPPDGGIEHLAIMIGHPELAAETGPAPLVRVHSECFTGDLLGSRRCDCGPQLHQAIARMAAEGAGVLLYMAQEGRGIGLVNKLRAYSLQDGTEAGQAAGRHGLDTLDANRALGYGADERSFAAAATMLRRLGIFRVRLLTNNPDKIAGLVAHGIEVTGRVSHAIAANGVNDGYLATKARRFGHLLG